MRGSFRSISVHDAGMPGGRGRNSRSIRHIESSMFRHVPKCAIRHNARDASCGRYRRLYIFDRPNLSIRYPTLLIVTGRNPASSSPGCLVWPTYRKADIYIHRCFRYDIQHYCSRDTGRTPAPSSPGCFVWPMCRNLDVSIHGGFDTISYAINS